MAVPTYTLDDFEKALRRVGVTPGSVALLHSSLVHIGRLAGEPAASMPDRLVDRTLALLGTDGTLAAPASNWDYGSKSIPFDIDRSPPARALGVVSRHVLTRAGVARSHNPIFNLAALGSRARWICDAPNPHAVGHDSAWDRLFQLNATIVLLGCDFSALSFTRLMECRFGVPYLFNKFFNIPVVRNGKVLHHATSALVRYRHLPIAYNLGRLKAALDAAGAVRATALGGGEIAAVTMADCFEVGMRGLQSDVHYFLERPPDYSIHPLRDL